MKKSELKIALLEPPAGIEPATFALRVLRPPYPPLTHHIHYRLRFRQFEVHPSAWVRTCPNELHPELHPRLPLTSE